MSKPKPATAGAVVSLALLLAACGTPLKAPSDQEFAVADFGLQPSDHEALIKAYYDATLKDPSSAQYRAFTEPKKYWLGDRATGGQFGYIVCVQMNAKNSYGGYVGFKTDGFFIRDGRIVRYIKEGEFGGTNVC